jgi:hypothetical protein
VRTIINCIALALGLCIATPALPDPTANLLGNCMVDSLNGKERKQLAKWIFFAVAAHPDMKSYSTATAKDIDESDRTIGNLITRLLTEDCPNELQSAQNADPLALKRAFELVGQVAMQELMADQNVMKAITNYSQYVDQQKINALLTDSGARPDR